MTGDVANSEEGRGSSVFSRLSGKLSSTRARFWLFTGAIVFSLLLGLCIRVDNLMYWQEAPDRYFMEPNNTPVILNMDGYYYLDLARDLLEGEYSGVDHDRFVPQGDNRPATPPLLSVMTAAVTGVTGLTLEKAALVLSPFLGVLLFIPVFLFGRYYSGNMGGIVAGFFTLIYPYYVLRTSVGWYDTDVLNVTLAAGVAYCFLRLGTARDVRKRLASLLLGLFLFGVFLWWWESKVVAGLCLFPLLVSLVVYYRPNRKEGIAVYSFIGLVLVGFTLWYPQMWNVKGLAGTARYIFKVEQGSGGGNFPVTGAFVEEQGASFANLVPTERAWGFVLLLGGVAGLAGIVWRHRSRALVLAPLVALTGLCITATRFQIFAAPVISLGLGFLVSQLWMYGHKSWIFPGAGCFFIVAPTLPALAAVQHQNYMISKSPPHYLNAMRRMKQLTPEDAVIWARWGYGYPIQFYAGRGTIGDGKYHGGKVMLIYSVPLAAHSDRLAANWIQFYTARGRSGLNKVRRKFGEGDWSSGIKSLRAFLRAGPEKTREMLRNGDVIEAENIDEWVRFFFPADHRPVYIFFDKKSLKRARWYAFGHWDLTEGKGYTPPYIPFPNDESIGIRVDKENGDFYLSDGRQGRLVSLGYYRDGERLPKSRRYDRENGLCYDVRAEDVKELYPGETPARAVLAGQRVVNSLFHRFFIRLNYNGSYFKLIKDKSPRYQIWKVRGDGVNEGET